MNIINNDIKFERIINKSRFICILKYIDNIDSIDRIFDEVKTEYKNASHYCYSYIIENNIKYSDDGEPTGSAGLPIYNAMKNYEINNVICIVIRYFGGIKLGLGPLTRAYFNIVNDTIKEIGIKEYIEYKKIRVSFNYNDIKSIEYILKDYIIQKKFDNLVEYVLNIPNDKYINIINKIQKYKIKIDE